MCVSDMLIDKQLYFLNTENCLIFASAERGFMFECLNVRMLECLNGGLGGLVGLEFRGKRCPFACGAACKREEKFRACED